MNSNADRAEGLVDLARHADAYHKAKAVLDFNRAVADDALEMASARRSDRRLHEALTLAIVFGLKGAQEQTTPFSPQPFAGTHFFKGGWIAGASQPFADRELFLSDREAVLPIRGEAAGHIAAMDRDAIRGEG